MVELMTYSSRRKLTGADIESDKRKECVVSVKCEKEDYDIVVQEAGKLGLSFSEIIRRLIKRCPHTCFFSCELGQPFFVMTKKQIYGRIKV